MMVFQESDIWPPPSLDMATVVDPDSNLTSFQNLTADTEGDTVDYDYPFKIIPDNYDYLGASLFVTGLLTIYGIAILLFIISLIRKSRTELELVDHLEDFEAIRRASIKRRTRDSLRSSFGDTGGTPPNSFENEEPVRTSIRRPLQRSQRVEESEEDVSLWLHYDGSRGFRHPGKIISYNPGLLRDDTYQLDKDFIIV